MNGSLWQPASPTSAHPAPPGANPCGELWDRVDRCEHVALGVGPHGVQLGDREADEERHEIVVRREGEDHASLPPVDLQAGAHHTAVVREVPARRRRRRFPHGRPDPAGESGVAAVGADHDGRPLRRLCSGARVAADDARQPFLLVCVVLDREAVAHLGAGGDGRVDEDPVEAAATWPDAERDASGGEVAARQRDVAQARRHRRDRRAGRLQDRLEQAPAGETSRAVAMDEVPVRDVAGKRGAVDEQHAQARPGQQHRGRRAGTARSDHDDVIRAHVRVDAWGMSRP
jgi:hypothetical protein